MPATRSSRITETLRLLKEYVRTPRDIGAVAPCSPALTREVVARIDWPNARAIVELGAGTGGITSLVIASAPPNCRVILIERNPRLVSVLRDRYPAAEIVHGDAQHAARHCRDLGVEHADVVLAGLPWASLPPLVQGRCLRGIRSLLGSEGAFATYAQVQGLILPAGRRFARQIQAAFADVVRSPIVWRSVPPSLVYHCRGAAPTR